MPRWMNEKPSKLCCARSRASPARRILAAVGLAAVGLAADVVNGDVVNGGLVIGGKVNGGWQQ